MNLNERSNEEETVKAVLSSEAGQLFRSMLFMRIVPNLKKLGLITPRVRESFTNLGIIQFEDFDTDVQDRELAWPDRSVQSTKTAAPVSRPRAE